MIIWSSHWSVHFPTMPLIMNHSDAIKTTFITAEHFTNLSANLRSVITALELAVFTAIGVTNFATKYLSDNTTQYESYCCTISISVLVAVETTFGRTQSQTIVYAIGKSIF